VTLGSTDTQFGSHDGDEVGDTLVGIEAVRGSDVNDDGDTLASLLGAAILDGGLGDDLLIGGAGTDSYIGGFGSDRIDYQSSTAAVTVDLSSGQGFGGYAQGDRYDTVEDILGSSFADVITGIAGFNTFYGFDGADTLYGGSSTDSLVGGNDDDYIEGGSGADLIDGGAGANDVAGYTLSTSAVQVDISDSLAETGGDAEGDRLTGVEHLVGSNFNDVLTGDANVNRIFGQSGSDRLNGGLGADSLFGGSGADAVAYDALDAVIMGGVGLDTLYGNAGGDVIQLDAARFHFAGGFASFESIALGSGNDWFLGSSNAADFAAYDAGGVVVSGGSGSDNISMRGNNALVGIDDSLYGGAGRDNIWAGNGNDEVSGDSGNDLLYGGFGNDQLAGGSGFDVVYFGRDEGDDVIEDGEGLVIFWGNDALQNGPLYDGVDPSEIQISYGASTVTISFTDGSSGSVTFDKGAVTLINLFDYGNGEAGNGPTPPPNFTRDIWSADWDPGTQTFTAFTKVVDG
jgi:Ca2+-binding RTX toxin-like protein